MRLVCCYKILAATLVVVIQIINAHPLKSGDENTSIDYRKYDDHYRIFDPNMNNHMVKTDIMLILGRHNLDTNLNNYKFGQHHDNKKFQSTDYLNDRPYTSLHFEYHDDLDENIENSKNFERDEHIKKLLHAIEHNELLELYVECAKFFSLKEEYYQNRSIYEKGFNRQLFNEIENFCEFIKIDDDDFIM